MSEELNEVQEQQQEGAEDRARRMGWVPQEEFRGDPDKWVDAEKFVDRADNELPVLRENLKRMERKYQQMERTLSEFREYTSKSEQRAYERALKQIQVEQRRAVEEADVERYDAAQTRYDELQKELQTKKQQTVQEMPPEFVAWKSENQWYDRDAEMTIYANTQGEYIGRTKPHLVGEAFYKEVEKRVRKEFPEKFENPKRREAGAVHGSGENDLGGKGKRGPSYSDLPADAKEMCDRFVKTIPGYTREQYLKDYTWS